MTRRTCRTIALACASLLAFLLGRAAAQSSAAVAEGPPHWQWSLQYLGLTFHPEGGDTPEVYPLKLDPKAYLVVSVGIVGNLDYRFGHHAFFRFTSSLYKDCAFLTAGCLHLGPRLEFSAGRNSFNAGIGPIFSFRRDWHRFAQYVDDEFYGRRVWKGWQYRFYMTAVEFEYLRRISDRFELQWSLIPGVPLVVTSLFGVRIRM